MSMIELAFMFSVICIILVVFLGRVIYFAVSVYAFERCCKKGVDMKDGR